PSVNPDFNLFFYSVRFQQKCVLEPAFTACMRKIAATHNDTKAAALLLSGYIVVHLFPLLHVGARHQDGAVSGSSRPARSRRHAGASPLAAIRAPRFSACPTRIGPDEKNWHHYCLSLVTHLT